MYGWLWNRVPGGTAVRCAAAIIVVTAVAALLWYQVFPLIDEWFTEATVS